MCVCVSKCWHAQRERETEEGNSKYKFTLDKKEQQSEDMPV